MTEFASVLRVVHVITAMLMVWPFYALVSVNQRVRLGPPLGDRADTYMENIIKNRALPCFVFQVTALITGLALIVLRGEDLSVLITNVWMGLKFALLLLIMGSLSYVHVGLQPRIDALFSQAGNTVSDDLAARIGALRARRKRLASMCLFVVLTLAMMGAQVWEPFPLWLTAVLLIGIGLFTWRAYRSEIPWGWI
jgi:hypothetical protein